MDKLDKIEVFKNELAMVSDPDMHSWCTECVAIIPDYIFKVPASATGKHHPVWSLGEKGLIRHIQAVTHLVPRFARQYSLDAMHENVATVAALLHDSLKYGFDFDYRYHNLHPYLPREHFKKVPYSFDPKIHEMILVAIESHMGNYDGSWCYLPYVKPSGSRTQLVVHLADYTAADSQYIPEMFLDVNRGDFERSAYVMDVDELSALVEMYVDFDEKKNPGSLPPDARKILLSRIVKVANLAEAFSTIKLQAERIRSK